MVGPRLGRFDGEGPGGGGPGGPGGSSGALTAAAVEDGRGGGGAQRPSPPPKWPWRGAGGRPPRAPRPRRPPRPPPPGHSTSAMALGALMLWFGWYGFNIAPAYGRGGSGTDRAALAARAAVNTTLSACAAGLAALGAHWAVIAPTLDLRAASNGVLGGIVAATATCAFVDPWAGAAAGAVAGVATVVAAAALARAGVDDPLDSVAVHAAPALVGLLCAALFARPAHLASLNGPTDPVCGGLVYVGRGGGGWTQLGVQVAGAAAIAALSAAAAAATFGALRAAGRLRVDTAAEVAGIDHVDHGGPAYPDFELRTREW